MTDYFAHTSKVAPWQPLKDHLRQVAAIAKRFAEEAWPANEPFAKAAYFAGLLHDLGKYRLPFQEYLNQKRSRSAQTGHKLAGAAYCNSEPRKRFDIALAIAGHHGGLPERSCLLDLDQHPGGKCVVDEVWEVALSEIPEFQSNFPPRPNVPQARFLDLWIRLLFSCLVDADWQDTNNFVRSTLGLETEPEPPPLSPTEMLASILKYIQTRADSCAEPAMTAIRGEVLDASLASASLPTGLFALNVPTGGGKTLASLAFAMAHAKNHQLRRVIYVAPYLSIIEQNAREIRRALSVAEDSPVVFEHHGLAEEPVNQDDTEGQINARYRRSESWESPVIVTTNVQFFDSLFSNQPSRCRKLHNIARSVVLLDECQTVPPGLSTPTRTMLEDWSTSLGSTFVLCTATQPVWRSRNESDKESAPIRDIVPASLDLHRRLKRVKVQWPARTEEWSCDDLVARMLEHSSALCVVNLKKSAAEIFRCLSSAGAPQVHHLSTNMCPLHRLQVIDQIRAKLASGEPCYVVSTQLIEAGVDLDFPVLFREMAPLDSIIQAAGRCNREGLLQGTDGDPGGKAFVFRLAGGGIPKDFWYGVGTKVVQDNFLGHGVEPDISSKADIEQYYSAIYQAGNTDEHEIDAKHRSKFNYPKVADAYKTIDDDTIPVVVSTWKEHADEMEVLLRNAGRDPSRGAFRALGKFQVNLFHWQFQKLQQEGFIALDGMTGLPFWLGEYDAMLGLIVNSVAMDLVI